MVIGNEWEEEKKMVIGNGEDAEKMFQLYIYNRMKQKNLHDVAEIYKQEANLETSQVARCEENLLTEWWELFWPTFCSRMSNKAGANAQSSGQSVVNAMAMLASLKNQGASSSGQSPTDPQQDVLPVIAATGIRQQLSAPEIHQRRAGKLPMDTGSDRVLASAAEPLLVAEAFGNDRLVFAPVELLPGQALVGVNLFYTVPPAGSQSYLQLPATMETPADQVTEDPKNCGLGWSGEMKLTPPVGPNSTFTIVADHAGEANWNNQLPLTGVEMAVPGPDLLSYESRVPDLFLPFMRQAAGSNPPPEQSSSRGSGSESKE